MSKAFDHVPHDILIQKLSSYGVNYIVILWIQAYLSGRSQVVIDGVTSDTQHLPSGVPQGSVPGPVLFLSYINDIASNLHPNRTARFFVVDGFLYSKIKNTTDQINLNQSLQSIDRWCKAWGMQINCDKTVVATITNKRQVLHFKYTLGDLPLKEVTSFK